MKLLLASSSILAHGAWTHVRVSDWAEYKIQWGKVYNDEEEDAKRKSVFEANTEVIVEHNKGAATWWAAQNQFTDWTQSEFESFLVYESTPLENVTDVPVEVADYSEAVVGDKEWNVSPVKDQGSCGSCWTFGAVAGMEGEVIRQLGRNDILSEQQVGDCTSSNMCGGGRADAAYPKLYGKALYTLSSYPYTAKNGACHTGTDAGVRINSFTRTSRPATDAGMETALNTAAQVVAVGASSWHNYGGGVFTDSNSCSLNHQVYATGVTGSSFKVKNSWGKSWGESGYIRLARNSASCGTSGILKDGGFFPKVSTAAVEV